MDIKVSFRPIRDSFNSEPVKIDAEIRKKEVTFILAGNGEEGVRELTFSREQIGSICRLMDQPEGV